MFRLFACTLLAGHILATVAPDAWAQKKKVEITKKWSGSVENEMLMQPECITSAKGLAAVWKAWEKKGEVPKVDFTKNIVVAAYSPGSNLNMSGASLDDNGNLDILSIGTQDFGPGFRYVLGVVSKEGVRSVNQKALPKE